MEVCGLVKVAKKTHWMAGGSISSARKKKEFQHVFSKQLMFLLAQGKFLLVVANDLVQEWHCLDYCCWVSEL